MSLVDRRSDRILLMVLAMLLVAIGVVLVTRVKSQAQPVHAPAFAGPTFPVGLRAANFSLPDQNGHVVSLGGDRGRVVVLTFIHSLCKDTCNTMVEQIKGALNNLPQAGRGVAAIGISVAPAEDTRANRRAFLAKHLMQTRMSFLNGSPSELRRVWHAYAMQPVEGKLDHSTFVLLIDKRGIERVGFPADQLTPEGLAHDIAKLEAEPA
jgi:protein SCO1/2